MGKIDNGTILNLDKKRKFKLDLNAMINFEEETGRSLINMQPDEIFGLKDVRAMLWAGLNTCIEDEEDKLTVQEAGALVNPDNMAEVSNKIMDVYENAVPENDNKGETKQGKNKKRSAG